MLNVILGFVALSSAVVVNGNMVTNAWTVAYKPDAPELAVALEIELVSEGIIQLIELTAQDLMNARFNDVTHQFEITRQTGKYITLDFCNMQSLSKANSWLRELVTKKQYAELSIDDNLELAGLIEELIA